MMDVRMLIYIPQEKKISIENLVSGMKELYVEATKNLHLMEEQWFVYYLDKNVPVPTYSYLHPVNKTYFLWRTFSAGNTKDQWESHVRESEPIPGRDIDFDVSQPFSCMGWIDNMHEPWRSLIVDATFYEDYHKYRRNLTMVSARFVPDDDDASKGCYIAFKMPEYLWEYVDKKQILEVFQKVCINTNAQYGCIDYSDALYTIGNCPILKCSHETETYFPDKRLPGLFWAQWIPEIMVKETGTLEWIAEHAPNECTLSEKKGFLFMTKDGDIKEYSHSQRLLARDFFTKSLYPFDVDNIYRKNVCNVQYLHDMTRSETKETIDFLKRIPLTKEEIKRIKLLSEREQSSE